MTQQEFLNRYHYNPETDKLGAGGFGSVFKAYDTVYDREVAIKIAPVISGKENLSLMKEVELANKLPAHPNIVNYESCFRITGMEGSKDIGILQYYPEGSLATIIKKGDLSEEQKADLIKGILNGLEFLHEHKILHRDLKPGNVLIAKRENQYIPKIADFGLSRQVESFEQSSFVNSFAGGSAYYAAPEQLAGEKVRANVDLWSFGVILYELMTGDRPFTATASRSETENARQEIYGKIQRGDIPSKINSIAESYQTMIKACLIPDRKKRAQNVGELMAIMEGNTPNHLDLDKTSIEDVVTTLVEKEPPTSSSAKATFTTSSATQVKDKQQSAGQAPTETPRKKKKALSPLYLFGGLAIVAAIVGYIVWSGSGSDQSSEQDLWIAALEQKDEASYQAVVDAYPQGQYARKAKEVIQDLKEKQQTQAEEAKRKADQKAWQQAQNQNTIDSYQTYLRIYTNGIFVRPARSAIKNLKTERDRLANATSGSFTDSRDGKTYTWKRMKDGKKWMTQNLNYNVSDSWCYGNKSSNCSKYGRLYTLAAAISACPSGWRLPNDNEWHTMAKYYGGVNDGASDDGKAAYQALIAGGSSGFSAQLGGVRSDDGLFYNLGDGFYLSHIEQDASNTWEYAYIFDRLKGKLYSSYFPDDEEGWYSCRCIQD